MIRYAATLLVVVTSLTPALHTQTADCTFDRCALRVRYGFWGDKVVQGADAIPVATLALIAPRIELLETAISDSTRRYYETFRSKHTTGSVLFYLGTALSVASIFVFANDAKTESEASGTAIVLIGAGLTLSVASAITLSSGREYLSRSIWQYNRGLPR